MYINSAHTGLKTLLIVAIAIALPVGIALPGQAQCLGVYAGAPGRSGQGIDMTYSRDPYSQALVREAKIMERAFALPTTRLSWIQVMNCFSHPDNGVMMGEPMGKRYIQLSIQQNNPQIYSVGFGFVEAHEFAHQFQFKHLGAKEEKDTQKAKRIELQADLLGAYWVGVRIRHQFDEQKLHGQARELAYRGAADAMVSSAFVVGDLWLKPGTHGTKAQRSSLVTRALIAGYKGRFGDSMIIFKNPKDGEEASDAVKWMNQELKDILEAGEGN